MQIRTMHSPVWRWILIPCSIIFIMLAIFGLSILLFNAGAVDPALSQDQNPAGNLNNTLPETRLNQLEPKAQTTSDPTKSEQESLLYNTNTMRKEIVNGLVVWARIPPFEPCDKVLYTKIHHVQLPNQTTPITVVCDMDVPGGWVLIQQRLDGSVDFNRSWAEYRDGFGEVGPFNDFWLGLETIHQLTKINDQQLLVVLKDENHQYGYAQYPRFRIAGEDQGYKLYCPDSYKGDMGNALCFRKFQDNSYKFLTFDKDNDEKCAQKYGGGWWFDGLRSSNLNGPFEKKRNTQQGMFWGDWTPAVTYSRMLIRNL